MAFQMISMNKVENTRALRVAVMASHFIVSNAFLRSILSSVS